VNGVGIILILVIRLGQTGSFARLNDCKGS
ncbi:hypothetical protein PanWU01x14_193830, partial [Parasponia andersonii]